MRQVSYGYNELRPGMIFLRDGEPFVVLTSEFLRMQQRKPVVRLKVKHLVTGKVVEFSAQPSDVFEEAEILRRPVVFVYESRGEFWFHETGDKSKRFSLSGDILGSKGAFLKPNTGVQAVVFDGKIVSVELPVKMDFKVAEAPPSIKGNTAQGGNKTVVLETGIKVQAPLFINADDVVRVNTETGEYVERITKA